jgi:hypothetical protein
LKPFHLGSLFFVVLFAAAIACGPPSPRAAAVIAVFLTNDLLFIYRKLYYNLNRKGNVRNFTTENMSWQRVRRECLQTAASSLFCGKKNFIFDRTYNK